MVYVSSDFGVDSLSRFPFSAQTHTQSHKPGGSPYPLLACVTMIFMFASPTSVLNPIPI